MKRFSSLGTVALGLGIVAAVTTLAHAATISIGSGINLSGNSASGSTGVTVSATVAPILSMDINTGAINLGTLPTDSTYASTSFNLEFGTNAAGGLTATVDSANGGLTSSSVSHTLSSSGLTNEDYQVNVAAGTDDTIGATVNAAHTNVVTPSNKTSLAVYSTNKPERADSTADAVVTVKARADTATPAASDYADTLTFTVTATF